MPTLSISTEKVCFLVIKTREFDVQDVETDPGPASNAIDDGMISVLEDHADNPVALEIRSFVDALNEEERADLVTLLHIGRGDASLAEWEAVRNEALRQYVERTAEYLLGQPLASDYLEEGLSQLGFTCAEFEIDRL
jgi:hypothetical protein